MGHQTLELAASNRDLRVLAALLVLAMLAALMPRPADGATGDPVLINEALVSHTGADTTEFVELFGVPGTPLSGLSLVAVEGDAASAGLIERRVDFAAGAQLGGNGYFLVGNPAGLGGTYHVVPDVTWDDDSLENGSQTLALVATASIGGVGTTVTGTETVLDTVAVTDGGPSDRWFWSAPVVGPDDGFLPAGARRLTDGVDTDAVADWVFADDLLGPTNTPTPATPFNAPTVADCGAPLATDEGTAITGGVTATDPDGRVVSFGGSSAPDPGTISVGGVVGAAAPGQAATAVVDVGAATPPGSYVVTVTATNDDAAPQSAECTVAVTVNDVPDPPPPPGADTGQLWATVNRLVAAGGAGAAKAHQLMDRLERIDRFMASGQDAAALAQLNAFGNQVQGFSPRWISADAAAALTAEASALMAVLAP